MRAKIFLAGLLFAVFFLVSLSYADVPQMINYQGRLTTPEGDLIDTTVSMVFRIYADSTTPTDLWTETQDSVKVEDGMFNVLLGSVIPVPNSVFDGSIRYLGVKVGDDDEMSPRRPLVSVGYAFRSEWADTTEFCYIESVFYDTIHTDGDWEFSDSNIYRLEGNVGIGTNEPQYKLDVEGNIHASGPIKSGNSLVLDGDSYWLITDIGEMYFGRDPNTGSFEDVKVGIGTTTPNAPLQVNGAISRQNTVLRGDAGATYTHVNLGEACTTGTSGENWKYCTVGGGRYNTASGSKATVGGGEFNTASYYFATVGGGSNNTASDFYATVGGGKANTASDFYATVGGGHYNTASGWMSIVGGGGDNTASGGYSTVGGGQENTTNAIYGGVFSGYSNLAGDASEDTAAFVGGGYENASTAKYATVSGGYSNTASNWHTTVGGGWYNTADEPGATVGGGWDNIAGGGFATVGGGAQNSSSQSFATVVGGGYNTASGSGSTVGGGYKNLVQGDYSAILGGYADTITAEADYSYLFGIDSKLTEDSTFMVDMPHIRFGDETNGYEFPPSDGVNSQVMATNGSGQLSWVNVSGDGGGWIDDGTVVRLETSTDNVGIGTTSPGEKLDVAGNIHASGSIKSGNSLELDGPNDRLITTSGEMYLGRDPDFGDFEDVRVGIGTTTPNAALQVNGAISRQTTSLHGPFANTHVNLGVNSSTGSPTWDCSHATVSGGLENEASYNFATVSGGWLNIATDSCATVSGGEENEASGRHATVSGGQRNIASSNWATVSGGYRNTAGGDFSWAGGSCMQLTGAADRTFVWGHASPHDWINTPDAFLIFPVGAEGKVGIGTTNPNAALQVNGAISRQNTTLYGNNAHTHVNLGVACTTGTSGEDIGYCTVGGGHLNTASRWYATVGGGFRNTASGDSATVGGGFRNTASGQLATVAGGEQNRASGQFATVGGGWGNTASGPFATVGGGASNTARGGYSFAAGRSVTVTSAADNTFAFGRNFTTTTPNAVIFHNSVDDVRVGIGTANPTGELTVQGDIRQTNANGNTLCLIDSTLIGHGSICTFTSEGDTLCRLVDTPRGAGGIGTWGPNGRLNIVLSDHMDNPDNGYISVLDADGLPRADMFVDPVVNNGVILTRGADGSFNITLDHLNTNEDHGSIIVYDGVGDGQAQAGMRVDADGNGIVWGDEWVVQKSNPNQPGTDIVYASIEGPEAAAYIRGTAHLVNGRAEVAFPEHFKVMASSEGITVQLTPLSAESKGLAVVEKSPDRLVVRELGNGDGTYDFDYMVMAVRKGYEDYQVIRPASEAQPAEAEAGAIPR